VRSFAEDAAGNLWIANQERGLVRLSPDESVQQTPWTQMGRQDYAASLAADPTRGGLWIGFHTGGIAYFANGQVRAWYTAANGLGEGRVNGLLAERGALWAATEGGLSRLKNGRITTLAGKNGLPCDAVHWVMQDDARALWLLMPCGLARIERSELDAWTAAIDQNKKPGRNIPVTVWDSSDGAVTYGDAGGATPKGGRAADGKLWFPTVGGVSVIDPRHLISNLVRPPVQIERVTADRKTYEPASDGQGVFHLAPLPPLVRDLEIDYTALSFVAPEKVRFRYRLEGHDRDWQEVTRRQAFYSDLKPRKYRFRVMAANNSGVWNEAGAYLDFSVAPAYWQTTWFGALCVAGVLALLAGSYWLRLLYLTRQFNVRLEERVSERTRIARDLHDTLLQSFQGVLLKFHAVRYIIPNRPEEAQKTLDAAIEEARQAIAEGRDAVQGLRSSAIPTEDIARAITTFGEGLVASANGHDAPRFQVHVEGAPRDLAPVVRDEIYRIAGEGLRNAFRHSRARRIEVDIHYDKRQLCLRVRDDGKGIDPQVLDAGGRAGHHGLPGMRERAQLIGGKLAVWSEPESGTEIELTVSSAIAYAKSPIARQAGQET